MGDWLLLSVTLGVFAVGFFAVRKLIAFMEESQRPIAANVPQPGRRISIAAETSELLAAVTPALKCCPTATPHAALFPGRRTRENILHKLSDGTLDIALLTKEPGRNLPPELCSIQIPGPAHTAAAAPINDTDKNADFAVVWNKRIACRERDGVIFMIKNEHCSLKGGYCNYWG